MNGIGWISGLRKRYSSVIAAISSYSDLSRILDQLLMKISSVDVDGDSRRAEIIFVINEIFQGQNYMR